MSAARPGPAGRPGVLIAAGGERWESAVVERLGGPPLPGSPVLLKRCLDLGDLLATATTGTAQVAVLAAGLAGLDTAAVQHLDRYGIRTVAVGGGADTRARLLRLGVAEVVGGGQDVVAEALADAVVDAVLQAARRVVRDDRAPGSVPAPRPPVDDTVPPDPTASLISGPGRLVVVAGPGGGPGRTTVAVGLAAELAHRGTAALLLDSDPYGGAVAQHLGVLDEVSGLLAATRLANAGELDRGRLVGLAREVSPRLRVLTGLPRPDRWSEVRPGTYGDLVEVARGVDPVVVVDAGFGLDRSAADPYSPVACRDDVTVTALELADVVVAVASADPVGLARLARWLVDLAELRPDAALVVVVNRMRAGLGWAHSDVVDLVARVAPGARVLLVPDDRAAADRALVSGRTLVEGGDSALRRGVSALADALAPELDLAPVGRRRRLALRR